MEMRILRGRGVPSALEGEDEPEFLRKNRGHQLASVRLGRNVAPIINIISRRCPFPLNLPFPSSYNVGYTRPDIYLSYDGGRVVRIE